MSCRGCVQCLPAAVQLCGTGAQLLGFMLSPGRAQCKCDEDKVSLETPVIVPPNVILCKIYMPDLTLVSVSSCLCLLSQIPSSTKHSGPFPCPLCWRFNLCSL